jgi:1,2-diacylglycerol 3-alpha-glucosyltransferase
LPGNRKAVTFAENPKIIDCMNILILNSILYTAQHNIIPQVDSIKDCMIYNFALGFTAQGHDVTLVAASEYQPMQPETYDFRVIFVPSALKRLFPPAILPFQPQLFRFLRNNGKKYDLIVTSEVFAFPSLLAALLCPRRTVVWQELTVHQQKFHSIPSRIWHHTVARWLISRVRRVIPRSDDAYRFISRYMSNVSEEIVDHGIAVEKFRTSETKRRQFICVAQLIPRKNVGSIIDRFHKLVLTAGYEDFRLYIAGRGELEDELKRQMQKQGLAERVVFLGFLKHESLAVYVRESYALLVNTRQDLNMVSIPEAIVSGTPVVTNRVPASARYIHDHRLGIARTEWNETDLKEIIDHNAFYVQNCIAYRQKLSNTYLAGKMIEISKNQV